MNAKEMLFNAKTAGEVREALAAGEDIEATDRDGETALISAVRKSETEAVKALIAAGADVNAQDLAGDTALMRAAGMDSGKNIKALIAAGADVNAQDQNGRTALMLAARFGSKKNVEALIAAGANVEAITKDGRLWVWQEIHTSKLFSTPLKKQLLSQLAAKSEAWNCNRTRPKTARRPGGFFFACRANIFPEMLDYSPPLWDELGSRIGKDNTYNRVSKHNNNNNNGSWE